MRLASAAAVAAIALAIGAPPARAQSTRYPREPVDADKEADEHSDFWERALEPDRGRYDVVLAKARRLIDLKTATELGQAVELLDTAVALLPGAPDAYYLRGWAHELSGDWAACADDYTAAADRDPAFEPAPNPRTRGGLADAQGLCLSRAGRFTDAEAILAQVTATGDATAAVWMRLGEVDMALGRLDDAIAALDHAVDRARSIELPMIRWLRAAAFDRARRPGEAADEAQAAYALDSGLSRVVAPGLPTAPEEDVFYLYGIAFEARGSPEQALLYYREFLRRGAKSQWRKRAEDHVAALRTIAPADALTRDPKDLSLQGTSTLTRAAIAKALHKELAGLGRCLDHTPQVIAEVRVVVHGAPAPPPKRGQPVVLTTPPPAGATSKVLAQVGDGAPDKDVAAGLKCLNQAAGKLRLPRLERGTWVQLTFPVISR